MKTFLERRTGSGFGRGDFFHKTTESERSGERLQRGERRQLLKTHEYGAGGDFFEKQDVELVLFRAAGCPLVPWHAGDEHSHAAPIGGSGEN